MSRGVSLALAVPCVLAVLISPGQAAAPREADILVVTRTAAGGAPRIAAVSSGGGRSRILASGFDPAWAPDGSRIAFAALAPGTSRAELHVMRADGTGLRRLTRNDVPDRQPSWSPDGRSLVFVSDGQLAVIPAGGGAARPLLADGLPKEQPAWSPDGSRIAFRLWERGNWDLAVVAADGSGYRRLTHEPQRVRDSDRGYWEETPRWSPDGSWLAFVRRARSTDPEPPWRIFGELWLIRPDGSDARQLTSGASPSWSSDGRRLLFASEGWWDCTRGCDDTTPDDDVRVVGLDGSGERQLTRDPDGDFGASWGPGERRILFLSSRATRLSRNYVLTAPRSAADPVVDAYVANADGTCPTRLTRGTVGRYVTEAHWRPRPRPARLPCLVCADLSVDGDAADPAVAGRFGYRVTVDNLGNRASREVVLTVSARSVTLLAAWGRGARCSTSAKIAHCVLGAVRPGARRTLTVEARAPQAKNVALETLLRVRGRTPEGDLANNLEVMETRLGVCTIVGTGGNDVLTGTAKRDLICGREGDDTIRALGGDDWVNAGLGNDQIHPGRGRDYVLGRGGDDVVFARDGARDRIFCGEGSDRVVADAADLVDADCELVER